ncbi:MAG: alpha/beta hydrolase [Oscillospiraceae bacterium]|jgi:acetyl esterase/lipase|nr:alpha/beta hydrolase [Oscillospiraceae bacterium]
MITFKIETPEGASPMAMPRGIFAGARSFTDVRYSDAHEKNLLDVYLPETGGGPFPVMIFMHGGAYVGGDKNDMQIGVVADALNRGYALVSVEQRLLPDGLFPYPLFDFKAAIRFLRANAGAYMLDESKFVTSGASAGAYHAVMAAATQDIPAFEDLSMGSAEASSRVAATIGFYGVYDLIMQSKFTNDAPPMMPGAPVFDFAAMFLGVDPREKPELAYFADPTNFVTGKMPPTLLQAGTADEVVPTPASIALAERIRAVCGDGRVQLDLLEGAAHGDPRFNGKENQDKIFGWLEGVL